MDKRQRLQVRILLLCVKLIAGIHLTKEYIADLDLIRDRLKEMADR